MKIIFVLGICLAGTLTVNQISAATDSIPWVKDLEQAKQLSSQTNRPILLHFWGDYCPPCRRLEAVVFPHPTVGKTFGEHVIPVKVNVKYHQDLVKKYGIKRIPSDVVISPSGFVITARQSPSTSEAYIKFCQSVHHQYVGITDQKIQVANQLNQANQVAENKSRDNQGLTQTQLQQGHFVGTGDKPWSAFPNSATDRGAFQHRLDAENPNAGLVQTNSIRNELADNTNQPVSSAGAQKATVVNQFAGGQSVNNPGVSNAKELKQYPPNQAVAAVQPRSTFNPDSLTQSPGLSDAEEKKQAIDTLLGNNEQKRVVNSHLNDMGDSQVDQSTGAPSEAMANRRFSIGDQSQAEAGSIIENRTNANVLTQSNQQAVKVSASDSRSQDVQVDNQFKTANYSQRTTAGAKKSPIFELGLDGYCPVHLVISQQWVKGDPKWGVVHRERTYLFSSREALETFMTAPDKYSPALAGFDPVAFFHKGTLEPGSRQYGAFHVLDGENSSFVLCASDANRTAFKASPEKYLNAVIQAMREVDAKSNTQSK